MLSEIILCSLFLRESVLDTDFLLESPSSTLSMFSFWLFDFIVSDEKLAVNLIAVSFMWWVFFSCGFWDSLFVFLQYDYGVSRCVSLTVFPGWILLKIFLVHWLMFFIKFRKISAISSFSLYPIFMGPPLCICLYTLYCPTELLDCVHFIFMLFFCLFFRLDISILISIYLHFVDSFCCQLKFVNY